jgi:phosphopentomutase
MSMLTGTWQEVANDGSERPDRPTLFEYYRKHYSDPPDRAWFVAGKAKLDVCSYSTHPDYGPAFGAVEKVGTWSDAVVVDSVLAVLTRAHPVLLVANLPSVDVEGHSGDWDRYVSAIEAADSLVLEVWSALQDDPFYAGSTYFFVTNDHGRHDDAHGGFQNHGCACEGCEHVMLLVVGPEIVPGLTVAGTYDLRDICTTAGEILGCPVPESEGVTISEMFAGGLTGIPAGTP